MNDTEIEWSLLPFYDKLEARLKDLAWKAASKYFEKKIAEYAPVYHGPPRSSGRMPGTLKSGIKARRKTKWSCVDIPHPGIYVNYGVNVSWYRRGSGRIPKKVTRPTLFIDKGIEAAMKSYEESHKNII